VRIGALSVSLLLGAAACAPSGGLRVPAPEAALSARTVISGDGLVEFRVPAGYARRNPWVDCYQMFSERPYTWREFCVEIVDSVAGRRLTVANDSTRLPPRCFDCSFHESVRHDTVAFTPNLIVRESGLLTGTLGHYHRKPYWVLRIWLAPDIVAAFGGDAHGEDAALRELDDVARSIRLRPPTSFGPRSDSAVYTAALQHLIPAGDSSILQTRIGSWWGEEGEIDTLVRRDSIPRALLEALRARPEPLKALELLIGGWPHARFEERYGNVRSSPKVPEIHLSPIGYDERTATAIVSFERSCGAACLTHGFLMFHREADGRWKFVRFQRGLAF
jgi:hypothetical protein